MAPAPGASEALEGDVGADYCTWYLSPPSPLLNTHPMATVEGHGHSEAVASGCGCRSNNGRHSREKSNDDNSTTHPAATNRRRPKRPMRTDGYDLFLPSPVANGVL